MSIAWTSRLSYKSIQDDLSGRCREVWEAIRDWPGDLGPSIQDLAIHLHRKECSNCGRIGDLHAAGAIENGPLKVGTSGKQVKTYRAIVWQEPIQAATSGLIQLSLL